MDQNTDQKVLQKIGKYEILGELGQGGMGTVYKARDPFIGRIVALKTINAELVSDQEILKRFYREAQSAGTLQHPNIVTIFDLGEADGRPYIAMEFVEGESLQAIINRQARIPLPAKLKLAQQFCEGLGHAHKHGFVHRDVKPANIQVTNDGNVKVMDFGIVHLETTNLTKTGMFLGTIHYASPEQINDGRVDNKSDVWSVACVIYELIAYKKAFDGTNIAAIIAKVLSSEPEALSRICAEVPVELDAVISKGLKKNVEERYQSLDELLGDLLPVARRLQQNYIGDLLADAKKLRDKSDFNGAQDKIRAILILDNTHGEAKRLDGEIAAEVKRYGPILKAKKLVSDAEQAFSRGEYAEAVRILAEAQVLNPADTQARNLTEKARREQERVHELREALNGAQKATKLGDLTTAEQELHRALQIDQTNAEAAELLERIRQDRHARERDYRLKEALWQTDNLVAEGKYEEAQSHLLELQQDFPSAEEIQLKLQVLDPFIRSRKLVQEGGNAFNQGEYAEAVRALTEALELNPRDEQARELMERALQERDRLRQVREALGSGQRAWRQGDAAAAERELQRALQLDPTNTQATSLIAQIRDASALRERQGRFREVLQQTDSLIAAGKFDEAQRNLQELQHEFPDSTEIDQKQLELDAQVKLGRLLTGGKQAFDQGEFGEAVRILTEAQELSPGDERVRDLRARAVQERDRLRQVREAIKSGQRAALQGDDGAAEREFKRALQLDPASAQATAGLAQIQKDRQARERDQRLKEGLTQADKLISKKKFDDAQRKLTDLQQAFPEAEEIHQKLQALNQRKAEIAAAAMPPPPTPSAPGDRTPPRGGQVSDGLKSMQLAEELRKSLLQGPPPPAKTPAPVPASPFEPPLLNATQFTEAPKIAPPTEGFSATLMTPTIKAQQPSPLESPLPPPPFPKQSPPPMPAPPQVEPKKPAAAPPAARVTPAAPAPAPKKMSPMILGAVAVLVLILAVGGYMIFHHPAPNVAPETTPGGGTTTTVPQPGSSDADLFQKGVDAEGKNDWSAAIDAYSKVNGPMKDKAQQRIQQIQENNSKELAKNQKELFQQASDAFKKKDYTSAQGLYQKVIQLKVPDSTLASQAQTQLDNIKPLAEAKAEFDAAAGAQTRGNLPDALKQFQAIADKPGTYQAEAKARIPKLNDMINNAGALKEYNDALQVEKSGNVQGALEQFKGIAGKPGPFKADAQTQVQNITDQQTFDAAVKAQSGGDLTGALAQFKSLANKPGLKQTDAAQHAQLLADQVQKEKDAAAQQQLQQQMNAADQAQKSGDLKGALAQYNAIASKPGPQQEVAKLHAQLIAQLIQDSIKTTTPPTPTPAPAPAPVATSTPTPAAGGARAGHVSLIPGGDYEEWKGPVSKGQMLPDTAIQGGLKPAGPLTVPPLAGAPAGASVVFIITIDPNGNVTPGRKTSDDSALGPQVMPAAKGWKFNPPIVKGKPVSTSIQVKVSF